MKNFAADQHLGPYAEMEVDRHLRNWTRFYGIKLCLTSKKKKDHPNSSLHMGPGQNSMVFKLLPGEASNPNSSGTGAVSGE